MIDPAMIRPGRLDKLIYVDLPSPAERLEILKTHTKRTPLQADSQTEIASIVMSSQCDGFSGADIAALVKEASSMATMAYMRARRQAVASGSRALGTEGCVVTVDHFREAAKKTLPSVGRDQIRKFERMRDRYAGLPSKGKRMRDEAEIAVAAGAAAGAAATQGVGAEDVRMAALVG
jgi:ribosome biogenesis ATPase